MITRNDELFKNIQLKDFNILTSKFSHFGWEGTDFFAFFSYATGYKKATELIFEEMKKGSNKNMDTLIYPLCFNHRHCMEILLKYLYIKYSGEDDEGLKKFLNSNHNLDKIWKDVKPILEYNMNKMGSKIDIDAIEHYIKEMDKFDEKSMRMRYPITKQLQANNEEEQRLDFTHFHQKMLEFYEAIEKVNEDIDNQVYCQAPQDEYDLFIEQYKKTRHLINGFIDFLQPYVEKEIEKESKIDINLFIKNSKKDDVAEFEEDMKKYKNILSYFKELPIDAKKIIIALYEAGKSVVLKEVNLSISIEDRKKDFVNLCLYPSTKFNCNNPDSDDNVEKFLRYTKDIKSYLEKGLDILEIE